MKIVVLSINTSDSQVMAEPARRLQELGISVDIHAWNHEEIDDDPLQLQELIRQTQDADFTYIRCMSDVYRFKKFERYEKCFPKCRGFVFIYSGNPDVIILQRKSFKGSEDQFRELCKYCSNRGAENEYGLYLTAANYCGFTDMKAPEPVKPRTDGIYHPRYPRDITNEEYRKTLDPSKPTVGVVFTVTMWLYDNLKHVDRLIEIYESKGMNVIPLFYTAASYNADGAKATREIFSRYYTDNGQPIVDAIVIMTAFSFLNASKENEGLGIPDDQNFYDFITNVPVIHAIGINGEYSDFETDKIGLNKHEISANVAFPELDGDIIGFPVSYTPSKSGMKKARPIDDRIERMAELTYNWATLRRKPASERKVAILMWQSRPNSGCIGNAAGLDTPESIAGLLQELEKQGYSVDNVPENGRQMIEEILDGVTNDLDSMSVATMREKAVDLVPSGTYRKQFGSIPEWDQEQMRKDWGECPGTICVDGKDIVIPGIRKGNVFIGYQPLRGTAEKMEENIHDPLIFAQHQYLAYYRWIRDTFKADMVIHVGTHGTIEWLPGKNVGMSAKCDPDVVLGGLPNLYYYIVDDPGEGIQCKRRINSVLLGHMPPSMARAGEYEELSEMEVPLQDYFNQRGNASPERLKELINQIYLSAKEHDMFNDLNITEDPGAEGFEPYIIPLHEYISEVKDALVRADMHVIGRVPRGTHFDETVYSLVRLDNGDVRSLRDSFAENAGVDMQDAIDDPSGTLPSGELKSVAADRLDAELQEFLGWLREHGYDTDTGLEEIRRRYGKVSPDLEEGIRFVCEKVAPNIMKMSEELGNTLKGLNGEYVLPGPSGAPTRGNADILPMGRNFYSLDPDTVPNRTAWEIGKKMADQMIEKYVSEKGEFPREVGFIIWATDTMKTGGDDVAYLLWLMGVKPVRSKTGGQVIDLEVIPVKELGRPRVDVSINITGLFRDTFPNLIDLLDEAVNLVIGLDESDEDNSLAANLRKDIVDGIAEGLTPDEARQRNSVRIFGAPPGGYGTGVNKAIESGAWKTVQDLADVYIDWCSNGYSKGNYGQKLKGEFTRRFSKVSVTVKNMPDREIDLLDCDDVYEYLGGMNAFVRAYGKKDAMTIMGDGSNPKNTKVRSTKEELRYTFRSKVLNPKFINGLKEHGYRGAAELANITEYTMAWGATSDVAEDWMYEGMTDKFLHDKDTREWMMDVNPYAAMNILNRLEEAIERGLWNATDEYKEKLKDLFIETEERIEELTDR